MLLKAIEHYRTAGGREEHHAYKEALDNYIDDMLDIEEMDAVAQLGRPLVMERGPWTVSADGRRLYSDDFRHDASLTVGGDFGSDETRKDYADELALRLNRAANANLKGDNT